MQTGVWGSVVVLSDYALFSFSYNDIKTRSLDRILLLDLDSQQQAHWRFRGRRPKSTGSAIHRQHLDIYEAQLLRQARQSELYGHIYDVQDADNQLLFDLVFSQDAYNLPTYAAQGQVLWGRREFHFSPAGARALCIAGEQGKASLRGHTWLAAAGQEAGRELGFSLLKLTAGQGWRFSCVGQQDEVLNDVRIHPLLSGRGDDLMQVRRISSATNGMDLRFTPKAGHQESAGLLLPGRTLIDGRFAGTLYDGKHCSDLHGFLEYFQ